MSAPALALGCLSGVCLVTSTRLSLWRKDAEVAREYLDGAGRQVPESQYLFFGPAVRRWMVTQWNVGVVDAAAKPLIRHLADKGW